MERQFRDNQTMFDIGFEKLDSSFVTTEFITYNQVKKRIKYNELIVKYLKKENLSIEELNLVKKILSGEIYSANKKKYAHCKICSDSFSFVDFAKFNSHLEYFRYGFPTVPYYPGGFMLCLKDTSKKIENFQDLSVNMINELTLSIKELYNILKESLDIVGISVLFNQISKSELCIHGHVEPMFREVHTLDIGAFNYNGERYDALTDQINGEFNHDVLKIKSGVRFPLDKSYSKLISDYERIIYKYIEKGKRYSDLYCNPAPANFIYLTYYRDEFIITMTPSVTLSEINNFDNLTNKDIYCIKINQYSNGDGLLLREVNPIARPCIKVSDDNEIVTNNICKIRKLESKLLI